MNKVKLQKSGIGYCVANVENLTSFQGKAFVKEVVDTTSVEVSFGSLSQGESIPFFHHHKQNEELYIIISGTGMFMLNNEEIEITSGSIVKINPEVSRCIKCTSEESLIYICIQGKNGSLEQYTATDCVIEE
ncbi:cupin domain-containing protein [Xylanibacter muris]|uniref:Cupin domain-containing protein n=1 Tax=Xylanibacter muris TaxID=2736290 RepID=A0ABX2ANV9_9BACT|nr:cupin domain-containing protein [Xylanibacter muris]NPD92638.1 cupin domain-containing protein [Xylanibacter muris]